MKMSNGNGLSVGDRNAEESIRLIVDELEVAINGNTAFAAIYINSLFGAAEVLSERYHIPPEALKKTYPIHWQPAVARILGE